MPGNVFVGLPDFLRIQRTLTDEFFISKIGTSFMFWAVKNDCSGQLFEVEIEKQ